MRVARIRIDDRYFEARIERLAESGCWIWMRSLQRQGYGQTGYGSQRAHRNAWEFYRGPIPDGLHVLHHCDVRCCVNPDHLYLGTHSDNMRDMYRRGRRVLPDTSGEKNGNALLTDADIREIRSLGLTTRELAARFSISPVTVRHILNRKRWGHVP